MLILLQKKKDVNRQLDVFNTKWGVAFSETAGREQLAQLQILHKAQQRQIEDLERKLEDSRRNMRFVEHQFAIVKGKWAVLLPASQTKGGIHCWYVYIVIM